MQNELNELKTCLITAALSFALILAAANRTQAGPAGATIVRGRVGISQQGDTTTIRAGNNSIINFRSFDISPKETVQFIQPNDRSRVLNRVLGDVPTSIQGNLLANGQVYIVNPAGIYFGAGGYINVGGLIAAAGNISNQDFLNGLNHFSGLKGDVANSGSINANSVTLAGQHVMNAGTITSPNGLVALLAGDEVLVGEPNGHVFVNAGPTSNGSTAPGVQNSGTINVEGGRSILGAGDIYSLAVVNSGTIKARDVQLQPNGSGVVIASGTLDASDSSPGGKGGTIQILGDDVRVVAANIDASGDASGGTVLIGGDYHGQGTVPTAAKTYVDSATSIRADAKSSGAGGEVIVWSDEATAFHGSISAQGGAQSGNGGFVEISTRNNLISDGPVRLSAPHGQAGTLLYDPLDIQIAGGTSDGSDLSDLRVDLLDQKGNLPSQVHYGDEGTPLVSPFVIYQSEIEHTDANIVLEARNSIQTSGTFDNASLILANNRSLTLRTRNNSGDGNGESFAGINLTSSEHGSLLTISTRGSGNITMEAGTGFEPGTGTPEVRACALATELGAVSISTPNSTIHIHGDITAGGDITLNGPVGLPNSFTDLSSLNGNVRFRGNVDSEGESRQSLSVSAGRTIFLGGNFGTGNPLGQLALNGNGTSVNGAPTTIVRDSPGDVSINAQQFIMGQNEKLVITAGSLNITATENATLSDLGASGNITVRTPAISLRDRQPSPDVPQEIGLDFAATHISFVDIDNAPLSFGQQIHFIGTGNEKAAFATRSGNAVVNGFARTQFTLPGTSPNIRRDSEGVVLDLVAESTAFSETTSQGWGSISASAVLPQGGPDPEVPLDDLAVPESGAVIVEDLTLEALKKELQRIKITARGTTVDELTRSLLGRGLYEQLVVKEVADDAADYPVAVRRMPKISLARAVKTAQELFDRKTASGQRIDRAEEVRTTIAQAYSAYLEATKATGPDGFRKYLRVASSKGDTTATESLAYLNLFRRLLSQIKVLGLTHTEMEFSRGGLMEKLQVPAVRPEQEDHLLKEIEKLSPEPLKSQEPRGLKMQK